MLKTLFIENAAVIKQLELNPGTGFTVLSGETGSGKSVIIDCLSFVCGKKAERDLVRTGEERACVTAVFDSLTDAETEALASLGIEADEGEVIIERSLTADGKSSGRINARPVAKQLLVDAGKILLSLHSQDDTATLENMKSRTDLLDNCAKNDALLEAYRKVYSSWRDTQRELTQLRKNEAEKEQLRDILTFQIKEIKAASLHKGEDEQLLDEKRRIEGSEKLRKCTGTALKALVHNEKGITASYLADRASEALEKLVPMYPEYASLVERLKECRYELDDIAAETESLSENYDFSGDSDARLDEIGSRLETINKLKRKYGPDIESVIDFYEKSKAKLDEIENSDQLIKDKEKLIAKLDKELSEAALALSDSRRSAGEKIRSDVRDILEYLDMPKVKFEVSVTLAEKPTDNGFDSIDFMLAANPGEPLLPLEKCASGGELSRVMLALRCAVSAAGGGGTLVFDEIDTGISGKTSRKLGHKLLEVSKNSQVICVTHSAQVASLADTHMKISKYEENGRTLSQIVKLDRDGRIAEVSRILGGISVSEAQRQAAIDMIDNITE